jgi:hypothetical protein
MKAGRAQQEGEATSAGEGLDAVCSLSSVRGSLFLTLTLSGAQIQFVCFAQQTQLLYAAE